MVWAEKHRFGVRTQDPIGIEEIIADLGGSKSNAASGEIEVEAERRAPGPRCAAGERHEHSRLMARAVEFCCVVGAGAIVAGVAFSLVQESNAAPMSQVSAALSSE